jgi:hypothetical protein
MIHREPSLPDHHRDERPSPWIVIETHDDRPWDRVENGSAKLRKILATEASLTIACYGGGAWYAGNLPPRRDWAGALSAVRDRVEQQLKTWSLEWAAVTDMADSGSSTAHASKQRAKSRHDGHFWPPASKCEAEPNIGLARPTVTLQRAAQDAERSSRRAGILCRRSIGLWSSPMRVGSARGRRLGETGGRWWDRTTDPYDVNVVLSR